MKYLITILLIFTCAISFSQVKIRADGSMGSTGKYSTVHMYDTTGAAASVVKGFALSMQSITDRNNIDSNYRAQGMLILVRDSSAFYSLVGGITNADWVKVGVSGGIIIDSTVITNIDSIFITKDSIFIITNNDTIFIGTSSLFARNGLTKDVDTIKLGGTLDVPTSIQTVTNTLTIQSNAAAIPLQTSSSGNLAFNATTQGGAYAAGFISSPNITNTIVPVIKLSNTGNGVGANGIGASMDYILSTTTAGQISNQLISKLTDATNATRTSEFSITGISTALTDTLLKLEGNGQVILPQYGVGTFTGSPAYQLGVTSDHKIIETSVAVANIILDSTVLTFDGLHAETTFTLTRPNSGFKNVEFQAEDGKAAGFKQDFNESQGILEYQVGITGTYKIYIIYYY